MTRRTSQGKIENAIPRPTFLNQGLIDANKHKGGYFYQISLNKVNVSYQISFQKQKKGFLSFFEIVYPMARIWVQLAMKNWIFLLIFLFLKKKRKKEKAWLKMRLQ